MDLQKDIETARVSSEAYEVLSEKFSLIRENIHAKWALTKAKDFDDREFLYLQLHALNELERAFKVDIDAGKLASKQLEAENVRNNR